MQAAAAAETENRCADARNIVALGAEAGRAKRQEEPWKSYVVLNSFTPPVAELLVDLHGWKRRNSSARRNGPEVLFDKPPGLLALEVTRDREHGVVGGVEAREECSDVSEVCGIEIIKRTNQRVMERMVLGKGECRQALPPRAVRLIVDGPSTLVLHDVALRVEFLLCHGGEQLPHPVSFEPEHNTEVVRRNRFKIVRPIQPGRAIERAARALDDLEVFVRGDVC